MGYYITDCHCDEDDRECQQHAPCLCGSPKCEDCAP